MLYFLKILSRFTLYTNHLYEAFFKGHPFIFQDSFRFLEVQLFIFLYHQEALLLRFSHLHFITFWYLAFLFHLDVQALLSPYLFLFVTCPHKMFRIAAKRYCCMTQPGIEDYSRALYGTSMHNLWCQWSNCSNSSCLKPKLRAFNWLKSISGSKGSSFCGSFSDPQIN